MRDFPPGHRPVGVPSLARPTPPRRFVWTIPVMHAIRSLSAVTSPSDGASGQEYLAVTLQATASDKVPLTPECTLSCRRKSVMHRSTSAWQVSSR
jgi:hypothetical protein